MEINEQIAQWVVNLENAQKKDSLAVFSEKNRRLLYSINTQSSLDAVMIDMFLVNIKKNGDFGALYPYIPSRVEDSSTRTLDQEFLFFAYSCNFGYSSCPLQGTIGTYLFERLLSTGRLFYNQDLAHPLIRGTKRKLFIDWESDSYAQKPVMHVEGVKNPFILGLDPLLYLDPDTFEVGSLEYEWSLAAIHHFVGTVVSHTLAPTMKEEMSKKESLANTLPQPKIYQVEPNVKKLAPQPVLIFKRLPVQIRGENLMEPIAFMGFRYGNSVFHNYVKDNMPQTLLEKEKLVSIRRNAEEEHVLAGNLLSKFPLKPIKYYYNVKGVDKEYALTIRRNDHYYESQNMMKMWNDFLDEYLSKLKYLGWDVIFDPSFPYTKVNDDALYSDLYEGSGMDWFGLEVGIMINGQKKSLLPILIRALPKIDKILEDKNKHISIYDPLEQHTYQLPAERIKKLLSYLQHLHTDQLEGEHLKVNALESIDYMALELERKKQYSQGLERMRMWSQQLKNFEKIEPVTPPKTLKTELRPYQKEGLAWLQFLNRYKLPGILADDMGLGKTIQTLAHICIEKEAGRLDKPILIIAPTSLMVNWSFEIEKFAPHLKVLVMHGKDRSFKAWSDYDVILSTYPLIGRDEAHFKQQHFSTLILDESQFIKNAQTRTARVLCELKADHKIALTGTPLENHLGEIWSIFHFLSPGLLGSDADFKKHYRYPIEKKGNQERFKVLNRRLKFFILRRTKREVAADLPPKTEIIVRSEFEQEQRDIYEAIRLSMHKRVREELDKANYNQIVILDALLKLRQVCCHPSLLKTEETKNVKSSKMEQLFEMLPEMIQEGRKILLFSQFTTLLSLIEERLKEQKISYVKLTGSTKDRKTPIQAFQEGNVPLFLISLKAGGTGLNLTEADTVIHFDPWWNPAVENQATDRAHRIGQTKSVFVYKFIASSSVEEKILELQKKKSELMAALFDENLANVHKLSAQDINTLFEAF